MIGRKRRVKTTIFPLLTFNLKVGFTFSVLSPLACFQCADKLLFAPKHAKGMSLRYDAISIRAFC